MTQDLPRKGISPGLVSFPVDHRSNPKLHMMYVVYAYEELEICEKFLEQMNGLSRVTADIIAGKVHAEITENCKRDAAWFEAAALRYAEIPLPEHYLAAAHGDQPNGNYAAARRKESE